MRIIKCDACAGIYQDPQLDGSRYFHVCPLVENAAYQPDISLPDYDPRAHVSAPNSCDANLVPGLEVHDGVYVIVSRDPNDSQRLISTRPTSIAKRAGKANGGQYGL